MPIGMVDYLASIKDPFNKGLFENAYRQNPILPLFPVMEIGAPTLNSLRDGPLPIPTSRKLNTTVTDSVGHLGDTYEDHLAIIQGIFNDDEARKKWSAVPKVVDPVAHEYTQYAKAFERVIANMIFNGDVDLVPDDFNGLIKRFTIAEFPARQLINCAGGAVVSTNVFASAATAQTFFNGLDQLMYQIGVWGPGESNSFKGALFTNRTGILGFNRAAKLAGYSLNTIDLLGKRWTTYMGVPLVEVGLQRDKLTEIILAGDGASGYPDGTALANRSAYLFGVRFSTPDGDVQSPGSDGLTLITAGGIQRLAPVKTTVNITQHGMEWQVGLAHPGDDACAGLLWNFEWTTV